MYCDCWKGNSSGMSPCWWGMYRDCCKGDNSTSAGSSLNLIWWVTYCHRWEGDGSTGLSPSLDNNFIGESTVVADSTVFNFKLHLVGHLLSSYSTCSTALLSWRTPLSWQLHRSREVGYTKPRKQQSSVGVKYPAAKRRPCTLGDESAVQRAVCLDATAHAKTEVKMPGRFILRRIASALHAQGVKKLMTPDGVLLKLIRRALHM